MDNARVEQSESRHEHFWQSGLAQNTAISDLEGSEYQE